MKRMFILILVAIIASTAVFAEEATLIDFNTLTADYPADNPTQNEATLIDFSTAAGSSFTDEEKAQMKTSLYIPNWEVLLNSSARSVENQTMSYTAAAPVSDTAVRYPGETTLGIRVRFPTEPFNAWAVVRPPFEIPAYSDVKTVGADGTLTVDPENQGKGEQFDGFGVIKNIAVIKSISVNVHGLNFPQGLSIILKDHENVEKEYFLGYLDFDGWKTMTWSNPAYITEVRNRELRTYPLYPKLAPMQKLIGFRVYRDAAQEGGDFIAYIKDVSIVYDKAVLTLERDIDDEAIWGILQQREESRRNSEIQRLGNLQVLRYLESQKMDDPAAREQAPAE
jgi:hypothetical protein